MLYSSDENILFAGDSIVQTPVWLYLKQILPLKTYYDALIFLQQQTSKVKVIFTGHLPTMAPAIILNDLIQCTKEVIDHPGIGKWMKTFVGEGMLWQHGRGQILYDPQKINWSKILIEST